MCGGRGLRLHPLTEHTPKSLIEVGGKPMLETILDGFIAQGFRRFVFCEGYRAQLITDYFGDGSRWDAEIFHVAELVPLGTAGAIQYLRDYLQQPEPFIVTNADVIATLDNGSITAVQEKPIQSFIVNAGIYVLDPVVIELIHGPCNMPDVLGSLPEGRLAGYQIRDTWVDVGTFQSLEQARAQFG